MLFVCLCSCVRVYTSEQSFVEATQTLKIGESFNVYRELPYKLNCWLEWVSHKNCAACSEWLIWRDCLNVKRWPHHALSPNEWCSQFNVVFVQTLCSFPLFFYFFSYFLFASMLFFDFSENSRCLSPLFHQFGSFFPRHWLRSLFFPLPQFHL